MSFTPGKSVFLFGNSKTGRLRLVIATVPVEDETNPSEGVYVDITPAQARQMMSKLAEVLVDVDPTVPS